MPAHVASRGRLEAGQARNALRLATGPAGAAADLAAGAASGPAGQPRFVITEREAPVGLLEAVDPLERAAWLGHELASDRFHAVSVAHVADHRGREPVTARPRRRVG